MNTRKIFVINSSHVYAKAYSIRSFYSILGWPYLKSCWQIDTREPLCYMKHFSEYVLPNGYSKYMEKFIIILKKSEN